MLRDYCGSNPLSLKETRMEMNHTVEANKQVQLPEHIRKQLALEEITFSQEELEKHYNGIYNRYVKRAIDLVLSCVLLAVLLPFYLIIALCIVLESGFPVLYRAQRGGYRGKTFRICKFRSMVKNADKIGGGTTALKDSRITKTGAVLRKLKLDETAQIFNILAGTMSFVGPRPELMQYVNQYEGIEKNILNVRPGITDFSSLYLINLDEIVGSENADEIYEKFVLKKKNQMRLKYVARVSFKTDCMLFGQTVLRVLRKAFRVIFRIQAKPDKVVESVK